MHLLKRSRLGFFFKLGHVTAHFGVRPESTNKVVFLVRIAIQSAIRTIQQ